MWKDPICKSSPTARPQVGVNTQPPKGTAEGGEPPGPRTKANKMPLKRRKARPSLLRFATRIPFYDGKIQIPGAAEEAFEESVRFPGPQMALGEQSDELRVNR